MTSYMFPLRPLINVLFETTMGRSDGGGGINKTCFDKINARIHQNWAVFSLHLHQ